MSRLINQQEISPLFGFFFFKEKWLLIKIKSSVVAEELLKALFKVYDKQNNTLNCML